MIGEADGENKKKQQAIGICGTGMIDLVYELRKHQMIDEHGTYSDLYFDTGYELAGKVKFTQNDIREIQMAKAAIAVGQKTLLKAAGMEAWQVKKVYLAGGMGTFLNVRAAVETGLVEKSFLPVAKAGGNTSLQGAVSYLKKTGQEQILEKDKLKEITEKMQVLMLADMPDFADAYISHMALTEFKA